MLRYTGLQQRAILTTDIKRLPLRLVQFLLWDTGVGLEGRIEILDSVFPCLPSTCLPA